MFSARTIQQLLVEGREHAGLTQIEASEKIGIGQTHLSRLERGSRHLTASHLEAVIGLYGLDKRQAWELYIEGSKLESQIPDDEVQLVEAYRKGELGKVINLFQRRHRQTA